jgi:ATP-dependent Zn protease
MKASQSAAAHRDLARIRMTVRQRMATGSAYPLGPVDDPFFPVAVHEAGHALSALLTEGPTIDSLAIVQTERGGVSGRVRFRNADALTCKILLAGLGAELITIGYAERECAWSDLHRARCIAETIYSDAEAYLDRQLKEATALLESHRDALLALAREIVNKRYLSGGEVNRIINEVLAGRSLRAERRCPTSENHLPAWPRRAIAWGSR